MKEIIVFIIVLMLFGTGCASNNTKVDTSHLLYENPNVTYKNIQIEDWPEEFCEQQG